MPSKLDKKLYAFSKNPDVALFMELAQHNKNFEKFFELAKGDKGDKGYSPVKGTDYFTPQEIKQIIEYAAQLAKPVKGRDYWDGLQGRNGRDGKDGRDGRDGVDGVDGKNPSPENLKLIISDLLDEMNVKEFATKGELKDQFKDFGLSSSKSLEKRLNALQDAVMRNYGGHGGKSTASAPKIYSLSSQLDGVTNSFTIPSNLIITGVFGSSSPFTFDPSTDYTGSGTTTLTFTAAVDAASALPSGQTLIVQYV